VSEKRDVDGHQVWVLDRDHSGAGYIAQYKVLIQEVIEDPRAPDAS
jgi:hypothetical protein